MQQAKIKMYFLKKNFLISSLVNIALFFARKMQGHKQYKNTVSARIINIATLAVCLGISAILIAMSTSKGLQKEIQNKTSVFNGHILITLF